MNSLLSALSRYVGPEIEEEVRFGLVRCRLF
jgi:hypothetical protein